MADVYTLIITPNSATFQVDILDPDITDEYQLSVVAALKNDYLPRIQTLVSPSIIAPQISSRDLVDALDLNTPVTLAAPVGTPTNGQKLIIRVRDIGAPVSLTWNGAYASGGVTLPLTTIAGKWMHFGFLYNSNVNKWLLIAVTVEP